MNQFSKSLAVFAAVVFFAACGGETGAAQHAVHDGEETANTSGQPRLVDGVQVVEIDAGKMGFEPSEVAIKAGVPTRLVFTRTVEGGCAQEIQIPDYGIGKTALPLNEPVAFEITPEESGSVKFVCGMDMQTGTIVIRS